jgi:3-hydroxyisobutyrate dehydrogenase-like beta-hydroxyacid dehydrogenase
MAQPTIGFIGLGEMGEPMARHLLQHGFPVVSCANRRRKAIEALAKEGLVEAENPAGVGAKADIFMTIVVDQAQTEQVLRGPTGALSTLRPGSVIIIMSTIDPDYCKSLAQELAPRDIEVIDCPVSGGPHGAVAATLALMTGGAADVIERCRAPLEAMGTIFPCGEVGMGMVAKLANNGLLVGTIALVMEVRAMASAHGMDTAHLMEIIKNSTGNSNVVQKWDFIQANFHHLLSLSAKDAGLFLEAARNKGTPSELLTAWQNYDWSSIKAEDV